MLKIRLEPGRDIERILEPFYKGVASVFSKSLDEGYLRIASYTSLEAITASSIIYSMAVLQGLSPILTVDHRPPPRIVEPSILVGFGSLNYTSSSVESPLLAINSGSIKSTPTPGSTYVEVDGSLGSAVTLLIQAMGGAVMRPDLVMASIASYYMGRYVDRVGKLHRLDKTAFSAVVKKGGFNVEMVTTLKAYKPASLGVCESISITVNPVYPGLTGDRRLCSDVLGPDIADPGRRLGELSGEETEKIASRILGFIREKTRRPPDPQDYVGGIIVSRDPASKIEDARMAADSLLFSAELSRSHGQLVATIIDLENEYPLVESRLGSYSARLPREIEESRLEKVRAFSWFKAYKSTLEPWSPTLYWRALRLMGRLEREDVLFFEGSEGLFTTIFLVEEA
ncbi:MAG: hypothetical protein LRS43_04040, partial [Desulfurococcales archaeon]|nr:hypothetical protein [Desulfurococcales archaeon]